LTRERLTPDLAVLGAGSGGLSVAAGAAQLGLSVVLFEKGEMGGDCLNYGCVPSKALIAAAGAAHAARQAERLGVGCEVSVTFADVMAHVSRTVASIAPVDSQTRFEGLGVRVVREAARFEDARTVASETVEVEARKIVLATGSRAAQPPIEGLDRTPYLTNETIFELQSLPERLIVLGGGPIGCELGQAFRRLGSAVTLIDAGQPLAREDGDVGKVVLDALQAEGVDLLAEHEVLKVEPGPVVTVRGPGGEARMISGTHLLVAAGRAPGLGGLNLEAAGVELGKAGVTTDRSLRTTNRRVYAVGDVAGRGQFTHLAGAHAGLVVRRSLFALRVNVDRLVVPRVTYCDPELASVGMSEAEARAAHGEDVKIVSIPFHENDRAQAEGDTVGFGKLITTKAGKVLGVSLVGRGAGDQINLWTLAVAQKLSLRSFTDLIVPYPTRGEISKRLAGAWYAPALFAPRTRRLVSVLKHLA